MSVSTGVSTGVSQFLPPHFRCSNHPDREGVGICVNCRSVVCVECSTKVDHMNYCIACLEHGSKRPATARPAAPVNELALGLPALFLAFAGSVLAFALLGYLLSALRSMMSGGVTAG